MDWSITDRKDDLSSVMIIAFSHDRSKISSTMGWLGAVSIRGVWSSMLTKAWAPSGNVTTSSRVCRMSSVVSLELHTMLGEMAVRLRTHYLCKTASTSTGILSTIRRSFFAVSGSNVENLRMTDTPKSKVG